MTPNNKARYIWAFRIVGLDCGRDSSGAFHCDCGKCYPLRIDIGHGGQYRGDDCGDGRSAASRSWFQVSRSFLISNLAETLATVQEIAPQIRSATRFGAMESRNSNKLSRPLE